MNKPTWDEYFMNIAEAAATRSSCSRRHIGAIIVKDHRIISTGYNGTPKGVKNCDEGGCPRCASNVPSGEKLGECICCHAEENAIVQAAYHGVSVKDSCIYTTYSPCLLCSKMIINAGIQEVVYLNRYRFDQKTKELLTEANVEIRSITSD
jgi:dCMP deaminase